ncbi:hypothetical protein BZL30_5223 [Mycobacterium kansasii]|uniref:Uncharacterized protein n=1 Tax=Mycobacterium kansasii TaxID=1768 RepID=A0A1V3XD56_MYCKA|nr:hypothetical protein BZL30_5223 [Mycobacterium kansasii]OOK77135.1 hypothetical protein BZL29_3589 [Mycobacterium kansasii]
MNKQELARERGHSGAQTLLSGSMAWLAYNGHDGFPRVVPVGFTGPATASLSPRHRPPRKPVRFRAVRRLH